jgi:type II secretory pathway pseudopilin PulG
VKKHGTKALPANRVLGFTLTELMISLSLGLGLMTLMIDTIANISRAGRVSAEAAEATERAYFMIDVLDAWVSETAPLIDLPWLSMSGSEPVNAGLVSKKAKTAAVAWALDASGAGAAFGKKKAPLAMVQDRQMVQATEKDGSPRAVYPSLLSDHSIAALDLCESPTMSSFPLNRSGIAVVSPDNLACIPGALPQDISARALSGTSPQMPKELQRWRILCAVTHLLLG